MKAPKPQPFDVVSMMPDDTPDYMVHAWLDCLYWTLGKPEAVAEFRRSTGNSWQPSSSPIDRMIDASTGVDREFFRQFIVWFNVNVWGPIDGPSHVRKPKDNVTPLRKTGTR